MGDSDQYYIGRCLDGHPDDFSHLVRCYQTPLLAHLAGKLGRRDTAEEAAQETLVRAYFGLDELRKPDSFFSWLLGIADRVAKENQRSEQRRQHLAQSLSEEVPCPELSQDYALERAVAKLSPPYRQVILLRYYGGCSCRQVAEKLGMPLGTVTKQLSRAYVMLREYLQKEDEVQK